MPSDGNERHHERQPTKNGMEGSGVTAHIYHDISESDYHADPCPDLHGHPSLSSTMARTLLEQRASVAKLKHPRLGDGVHRTEWMDQKPGTRMGTMLHAALLGSGPEFIVIEDHDKDKPSKIDPAKTECDVDGHHFARDWKKKESRRLRDEALAAGQFPILHHERTRADKLAAILAPLLVDRGVPLLDGYRETTIIHSVDTDHGPVWIRARIDHYHVHGRIIHTDLKKTWNANASELSRTIRKFGYHIQQAAYEHALIAAHPEWENRIESRLAFMDLDPVPDVHLVELDSTYREIGRRKWMEAISIWAACLYSDHWPGYPEGITTIEPDPWYARKELDFGE